MVCFNKNYDKTTKISGVLGIVSLSIAISIICILCGLFIGPLFIVFCTSIFLGFDTFSEHFIYLSKTMYKIDSSIAIILIIISVLFLIIGIKFIKKFMFEKD